MRKKNAPTPGAEVRLMDISQLQAYLGMGKNSCMQFGIESGAVKKYGRRTLYDRRIIDIAKDTYDSTVNWITSNYVYFSLEPNVNKKTLGEFRDGYALIYTDNLRKFFTTELHIDFNSIKKEWADRGWLVKNSQGRYMLSTTVHGGQALVYKVKYEQGPAEACNIKRGKKQ